MIYIMSSEIQFQIMLLIVKDDPTDPMFDPKLSAKRKRPKDVSANSVKKVQLLAVVPKVQENYHNLKTLWDAVSINDMKTCVSSDHKVSNIISGIQVGFKLSLNHWKYITKCVDIFSGTWVHPSMPYL